MPALIDDKTKACRKARTLASDLAMYNDAKIQAALEADNFFEALDKEIDESRTFYREAVTPEIYDTTNYFDRALVDVVLARRSGVKTKFW